MANGDQEPHRKQVGVTSNCRIIEEKYFIEY